MVAGHEPHTPDHSGDQGAVPANPVSEDGHHLAASASGSCKDLHWLIEELVVTAMHSWLLNCEVKRPHFLNCEAKRPHFL